MLSPLLFLVYIHDLRNAIYNSVVHHFADDTNLLYVNKNLRVIQNKVNRDLKSRIWLRANKISFNARKTELIIFRDLNELSTKLSRVVGMLSKIRYYVGKETLHMVYYGIFRLCSPMVLKFGANKTWLWGDFRYFKIKL